jgi:pyruvate dehydrogenase E2 component (dihydrolipoamide acetyltransferase)
VSVPAASPLARRMARAAGLELTALVGTGPNGRIVRRDVERAQATAVAAPAAPAAPPAPRARGEETVVALSRVQRTVAVRMAQAKATVPEFATQMVVDMAAAVALRTELKALPDGGAPSYNDMVVKACGLALREHPRVNGQFTDAGFVLPAGVHVGIAVAGQDTLVVPVVRDADTCSLSAVARETRRLAGAVREQRIAAEDLADGTFTVSNLGMFGVTRFQPIVNPPQAAILGVGALREVPVVRDGAVVPGTTMELTLTADHRIVYGADAARFLDAVRTILEAPLRLLVADA